jgi:hypothetical protein
MLRKFLSTFLSHLPFNLQPHATQRPFSYLLALTPPCKQCAAPNQTPLDAAFCHDAPPSAIRSHLSDIGSTSAPALGRPHVGADRTIRIITGQLGKEARSQACRLAVLTYATDVRRVHGVRPSCSCPWCPKLLI